MKEGKVTGWLAEDGTRIEVGDAILEVETDKIAGAVEASDRRSAAPPPSARRTRSIPSRLCSA